LKLESFGNLIFLLIFEASDIIEKMLVLSKGKLGPPSTNVKPSPIFLLAGFNFFINDNPLISYFAPWRDWLSLIDN
jgi:hypothetical protein